MEPGTGAFGYDLKLEAGQYRLSAIGGGYHDSSQGSGSSWSFQLVAIPEPTSTVLVTSWLLLGAVGGRRLLRRTSGRNWN